MAQIENRNIFIEREVAKSVIASVQHGDNVWILGERGMGKTSLLYQIQQLQSRSTKSKSANRKVELLGLATMSGASDFYNWLAMILGSKKSLELREISRRLNDQPILLLLDDFEATYENPNFPDDFFATLRFLISSTKLQVAIASTRLPKRIVNSSPLENLFVKVELGALSTYEEQEILEIFSKANNIVLDSSIIAKTISLSKGSPRALLKILSLFVGNDMNWERTLESFERDLALSEKAPQNASLPVQPEPEPSEIIRRYGISEDGLEKHAATDKPVQSIKQDKLDFKIYVNALHSFIISKYTTTPITVSIDGVWGTGKSSLMSMLKGKLDPQRDGVRKFFEWWSLLLPRAKWYWRFAWSYLPKAYGKALIALVVRNDVDDDGIHLYVGDKVQLFKNHVARVMDGFSIASESLTQPENENLDKKVRWWAQVNANCEPMEPPYHYTVWLNAWKFDNQEEVWASLALATMEQIKQKHGLLWRLRFWWELTFSRFSFWSGLGQVIKQFLLPLVFAIVLASYNTIIESVTVPLDAFTQYGSPLLWAGFVISGILSVSSIFKDPFQIPLDKVFDRPNYKDKVKFLSHFEKDFARIVRAATKNGFGWKRSKLVIFIDDLDRCEPPKSADIVEAVNLFLDAEGCVFVIGMDSESVAMSIEVKYKELFERMKAENTGVVSLGRLFLDKIVQIPFSVPRPTQGQITRMVNDAIGNAVMPMWIDVSSLGNSSNMPSTGFSASPVLDPETNTVAGFVTPQGFISAPKIDSASYAKPDVRAAILKGTALLADNPREVKTFINLFRLSIYIANERKILEEKIVAEQISGLNLEKLAIWTACSVRWTGLVRHLYTETQTDSLCNFIHNISEDLTPEFAWKTGHKNIPAELKKKLDTLRKSEKGSEAHWCHLPWEWWLLEPDFLKTIKSMQDLWRPTATGETAWLKALLTMTKPIA